MFMSKNINLLYSCDNTLYVTVETCDLVFIAKKQLMWIITTVYLNWRVIFSMAGVYIIVLEEAA